MAPEPKEWPKCTPRYAVAPGSVGTGAIALTERRERLDAGEPGRRWPVTAASRRSRARAARALTGLRRSGMRSPSGASRRSTRTAREKAPPSRGAHVVGCLVRIYWQGKLPCWRFRRKGQGSQRREHRRQSAILMRGARSIDFCGGSAKMHIAAQKCTSCQVVVLPTVRSRTLREKAAAFILP
jgi:hypothetical protein